MKRVTVMMMIAVPLLILSGCGNAGQDDSRADRDALNRVQEDYGVGDVFSDEDIIEYAAHRYDVEAIFSDDEILEYITGNSELEKLWLENIEYDDDMRDILVNCVMDDSSSAKREIIKYISENYTPEEIYPDLLDYLNTVYEPEEIYPGLKYDPKSR